jgi:hypothetical protein
MVTADTSETSVAIWLLNNIASQAIPESQATGQVRSASRKYVPFGYKNTLRTTCVLTVIKFYLSVLLYIITTHTETLVTEHKILYVLSWNTSRPPPLPRRRYRNYYCQKSLQVQVFVFLHDMMRPHDAARTCVLPASFKFKFKFTTLLPPKPEPGAKQISSVLAPEKISCR